MLNHAFGFKVVERGEDLQAVVDLGGGAVQLQQVERVGLQVLEAAFDKCVQVFGGVTVGGVRV